jgi:hypothetical protein
MATVTKLPLVDSFSVERERLIVARNLPVFSSGLGSESLACGRCEQLIARNVDVALLYQNLEGAERLIVTCTCGANNLMVTERRSKPR